MKKSIWSLIVLSLFFVVEMSQAQVVVSVRPTAPVHVRTVKKQRVGHTWIAGHWTYNHRQGRYVWRKGHWTRNRSGQVWVAGSWVACTGGHKWRAGYWKPVGGNKVTVRKGRKVYTVRRVR